jgi:hypothetical protein
MTYREIVAEIERLPQAEQKALLLWLVKHARIETRRSDRRSAPPAKLVRGMLKPEGLVPTDKELHDDYVEYLIRKYV